MLTESELISLIISWKNQEGEEKNGRMHVSIDRRCDMYKTLIKTLIDIHGYDEQDVRYKKVYDLVMEASISTKDSEKKEGWKKAATADWYNAIDYFFPKQLARHDKSTEPERAQLSNTKFEKTEYAAEDPRLKVDNPVDRSIFEGLPPVNDPVDEDFMKLLKEAKGE